MQAQAQLHQRLTELTREAYLYSDELGKTQRDLKHKKTVEAVNMMQTTTTCVQKVRFIQRISNVMRFQAKETYFTRCTELEKLKQDANSSAKEISKVSGHKDIPRCNAMLCRPK